MSLLDVKDLKTYFYTDSGVAKAVDGVTFSVDKGKVLGIVGESGCGKSVTSLSIMRLVDPVTGKNEGGEILFDGTDILKLPEPEMRKLRGNRISMIFQEPMSRQFICWSLLEFRRQENVWMNIRISFPEVCVSVS